MSRNTAVTIFASCFIGGMIIGAWGWDKNESTIPKRTHGAVTLIVVGCTMIAGGLVGMFTVGNGSKQ